MTGVVAVALGGALGAVARYLVSVAVSSAPGVGVGFPWATLTINLTGSLGIGLAWGSWSHLPWFQDWGRAFLVVGVLGGFTTFSAFSLEGLMLINAGRWSAAVAYAMASVIGCLFAAWLGQRFLGV
ncbi:MAG: fluoride efflux transporter CrcB [Gammaproteobacteria bacterium]|nr:fluoride efflux transporter CrcB [Gammaproteobacteria bacterium]MYK81168.1 fluoride efflux transporter CrcB [Gammaproteobacteria bacterium]